MVGAKRDGWYCSSIKQGVRCGMDGNGFSFLFFGTASFMWFLR
jgi:hypothetical protein